jgi:hypothetical protein
VIPIKSASHRLEDLIAPPIRRKSLLTLPGG